MKNKRSLSGIFFRYKNPETDKWENWCFEDLPEEEQNEFLDNRSTDWLKSLAKSLANTLNLIGDKFDITTE